MPTCRKRGIAPQVIRSFLNAGLLYEDAKYHNCVFVGRDNSGEARFADLVEQITAESQTRIRFRLRGGIELAEQLREVSR